MLTPVSYEGSMMVESFNMEDMTENGAFYSRNIGGVLVFKTFIFKMAFKIKTIFIHEWPY
ncbi:MAG: hypothetical protein R2877_06730 [Bdellovibrionota bacterium]